MEFRHYITLFILSILFGAAHQTNAQIIWQECIGGSNYEEMKSMKVTEDNGIVFVGSSSSVDGDLPDNFGGSDVVITKLDSIGTVEWIKNFGGSNLDIPFSIVQTKDGGYFVAGRSASNDFDVQGNHGVWDGWVFKMDSSGQINWAKCLGGSQSDEIWCCIQTPDGGYALAGFSESADGDVPGNQGSDDFWIVKLNSTGDIEWSKSMFGNLVSPFIRV